MTPSSSAGTPQSRTDRFRRRAAGGSIAVGLVLLTLGALRLLTVLEVVPDVWWDLVAAWWPSLILLAGLALLATGRRITGAAASVIGGLWLLGTAVPAGYRWPVLLIAIGVLVIVGGFGGRHWVLGRTKVAWFDDVVARDHGDAAHVAVFAEVRGELDVRQGEPVECLAVFGDVRLRVPHDVAIELSETAIFGDVRAPGPPRGPVSSVVSVRATAVFGDVRLERG